jgi:signal transduction histidine kinase
VVQFLGGSTYSRFEYQSYLTSYEITQQKEVEGLRTKAKDTIQKIDELLRLTGNRIAASQNNVKRIQNILISAPRLYSLQELPNIQSIAHHKLSQPYQTVSRFGVFPTEIPSLQASPKASGTSVQKNIIQSHISIFDENETLQGVLEVKIALSTFKAFLGNQSTLSFTPLSSGKESSIRLLANIPFMIYTKEPSSFLEFIIDNKSRYALFFAYTVLVFLLFVCGLFYLRRSFEKSYGNKMNTLEASLIEVREERDQFEEKLLNSEQKYKSCLLSFQSYKKIHANLNMRNREQAKQLYESLSLMAQELHLSKENQKQTKFVKSCLQYANMLSEGIMQSTRNEKVNFKNLLEEIPALFAERIYKSKIIIDLNCPDDLFFFGDSLFVELVLMNVLGKSLYRIPKNGKVSITVINDENMISFTIQDKGFSLVDESEKLFRQAFDLFIPDSTLKAICYKNGLQYVSSRNDEGLNTTELKIPIYTRDTSGHNVVKLFQ